MDTRRKKRFIKIAAAVAAVAVGAAALFFGWRYAERKWIYPLKYEECVSRCSAAFGLDSSLVYALIKTESGFDERAESRAGALGLMQLTPKTAAFVAVKLGAKEYDLFDADPNILFGSYYLWYLSRRFKETATVLAAYNAGEGNVSSWLKDENYSADGVTLKKIPYGETRAHVKKTLKFKEKYESIHGL